MDEQTSMRKTNIRNRYTNITQKKMPSQRTDIQTDKHIEHIQNIKHIEQIQKQTRISCGRYSKNQIE